MGKHENWKLLQEAWAGIDPAAEDDEPAARALAKGNGKGPVKVRSVKDRFRVLNSFVDFTAGSLNRSEVLVWLVLWRDTRDGVAGTSQADIARRAGVCKRSVQLAIGRLEGKELLKIVHRGGLRQGVSRYRVLPLSKPGSGAQ